jgi:hypothetical protein
MRIHRTATVLFRVACLSLVWTCAAQSPQVGGPILGYLYDSSSRAIRPMLGIAGSASLGEAVDGNLDFGSIAPNGSWAVGVRETSLVILQNLGSGVSESAVAGAIPGADRAVWAADSSAAVVYSSTGRMLQRIMLGGGTPRAGIALDLSGLGSGVAALATSALGSNILVSASGGDSPGLYLISEDTTPALQLRLADPGAITFDSQGKNAYVVDRSKGSIWQLSSENWQGAQLLLQDQQLSGISALGSTSQSVLYLADAADRSIRIYDLAQQQMAGKLSVPDVPTQLDALPGAGFVLNRLERAGTPVWLLQLVPDPSILFVPGKQD